MLSGISALCAGLAMLVSAVAAAREQVRIGLIDLSLERLEVSDIPSVTVRMLSFWSTGTVPATRQSKKNKRNHSAEMLHTAAAAFRAADPATPLEVYVAAPFRQDPSTGALTLYGDELELAYAWFARNGVKLVGETFVGPDTEMQRAAIGRAAELGLVVFASAGNGPRHNSVPPYPASYDEAISISTTQLADELSREQERDTYVDFSVAPRLLSPMAYRQDPELESLLGSSAATATALGLTAAVEASWPITGRDATIAALACISEAPERLTAGKAWGRGVLSVASVTARLAAARGAASPCSKPV